MIRKPCALSGDYFRNQAVSEQKNLHYQYSKVLLQPIFKEKKQYMYLGFQMTRDSFHPSSGQLSIDIVASFTSLLPGLLGLQRRFVASSVPQRNNFAIFNPRRNSCLQIERKTSSTDSSTSLTSSAIMLHKNLLLSSTPINKPNIS